jgi:pantetheine-phosphate adenylyltransferase
MDRVREAVFSSIGPAVQGARALDLFAGTGAFGLEALSRGAESVVFVDQDRKVADALTRAVQTLAVQDRVTIWTCTAAQAVKRLAAVGKQFDLMFLDPPYEGNQISRMLSDRVLLDLLTPAGLLIVEHNVRAADFNVPADLGMKFERRYGGTCVKMFYKEKVSGEQSVKTMGTRMSERIAVYPGTFDPFHNGHLEIVRRALRIFDKVIIALGLNPDKKTLFSVEERLDMIRNSIDGDPRIEWDYFDGLLVRYADRKGATAIIRGLRAVSDFEYEFQLALMNRKLNRNVETFFLMTAARYLYVSSRIIKATVCAGGSPDGLVPDYVLQVLKSRFPEMSSHGLEGEPPIKELI